MNKPRRNGQYRSPHQLGGVLLLIVTFLLAVSCWLYGELSRPVSAVEMLSPLPGVASTNEEGVTKAAAPSSLPSGSVAPKTGNAPQDNPQKLDLIIGEAVDEFFTDRSQRSEMRMIMHCLAHRENGHAANRNCGDSGKACGPFQFHQPTWEGYRKLMIKDGLATEIGDRYDLKESARTTAWAISTNRSLAWGPIARYAKGSNYAVCQKPSWQ